MRSDMPLRNFLQQKYSADFLYTLSRHEKHNSCEVLLLFVIYDTTVLIQSK